MKVLKYNLIFNNQLCDKGLSVSFYASYYVITNDENVLLVRQRQIIYLLDLDSSCDLNLNLFCFNALMMMFGYGIRGYGSIWGSCNYLKK